MRETIGNTSAGLGGVCARPPGFSSCQDPATGQTTRGDPVQPVSPRIVELLNEALTFELTVTNTYFLHARMLESWGLGTLGKVFYDLSIGEMRDADAVIQRVLLFDGLPNLQRLGALHVGESPQEMLALALEGELAAVATFNAGAQECHDLHDHGTAAVFEEMVREEERHADWFEAQLQAIDRAGLPQYLAQQVPAGEAPA